jgi:hypothetical protein
LHREEVRLTLIDPCFLKGKDLPVLSPPALAQVKLPGTHLLPFGVPSRFLGFFKEESGYCLTFLQLEKLKL